MRGFRDSRLLDSPRSELLEAVTGIPPDRSSRHAMLKAAGVRSTQRLGFGDVGGGIPVFIWPAELRDQPATCTAAIAGRGCSRRRPPAAGTSTHAAAPGVLARVGP